MSTRTLEEMERAAYAAGHTLAAALYAQADDAEARVEKIEHALGDMQQDINTVRDDEHPDESTVSALARYDKMTKRLEKIIEENQ